MAQAQAPLLQNDGLAQASAPHKPAVLGVLSEEYSPDGKVSGAGDQRVSLVPDVAAALMKDGYSVNVQEGAGAYAGFSDQAYEKVGCKVMSRSDCISASDVLFAIEPPIRTFKALNGKTLISWVGRLQDKGKQIVEEANGAGVTLLDVTAVPRITIAQKLDVLSSQAKVAGHRAVIEATHSFGRFHAQEMTAAGKYAPSQTFVLGCGVAGLAAIGTSKALGSVVRAWDVRDVSDQCASMGAKWVKVDFKEDGAGAGGYAKESSDDFKRAQQETFRNVLKEVDIAISTAAIPGRRSPLLITKEAVMDMKPGSVIVDLAAVGGGNCELTRPNETYITSNGVTIIGYSDLPARMAMQSSAMYAHNMANLLKHIHAKEKAPGLLKLMREHLQAGEAGDIVTRSIVCCTGGKKIPMPPPPQPTPPKPKVSPAEKKKQEAMSPMKASMLNATILCLGVLCMLGMGEGVKTSLLTTFLLAGAAGYQAVWGVAHALHTPLMSVTNAISGMTAVGGLLLMQRSEMYSPPWDVAAAAVMVSSVNVIGGFVVSQRMLDLFKKGGEKSYAALLLTPAVIFVALSVLHRELLGPVSVVSALLCVAAIGGLASFSTAEAGCKFGMLGVFGALVATLVPLSDMNLYWAAGLMAVGGMGGLVIGKRVSPIALPQTVAAFHSLVGLAAMLTSIGSFWATPEAGVTMENVAAVLGDFIGGVTLTGSMVAYAKLNGTLFGRKVSSKELNLPCKNLLNLSGLIGLIALSFVFLTKGDGVFGVQLLGYVAAIACAMGFHLVASVGGGDMPVCITVLNSYSGWALVAEGFLLGSPVLTIVGSLIGFSGGILTKIMCDAMNRDIFNVLFGGINSKPVVQSDTGPKEHTETTVAAVAGLLADAKEVLVVPGYGMAQARAQGSIGELANLCRNHKINFKFGIHPVAGRMPGQMNVLLAEANVPHEWVLEMDEVNPDMENFDVVLVVGANDVVNSAAQEIEGCAIWGMPLVEVWRSKKVIFCKRSMATGYAALDNPVMYKENTDMLLGDAKKTADALTAKVRELLEHV